jgi:hypothetical protein
MRTQTAKVISDTSTLQPSHFIRKKGENPLDQVYRNGKWYSIAEWNNKLNINKGA